MQINTKWRFTGHFRGGPYVTEAESGGGPVHWGLRRPLAGCVTSLSECSSLPHSKGPTKFVRAFARPVCSQARSNCSPCRCARDPAAAGAPGILACAWKVLVRCVLG